MNNFVIFNRKTGTIVHVHTSTDGVIESTEHILHHVGPSHNPKELDVLRVSNLEPNQAYSVNIKTKQLERIAAGKSSAFGGFRVQNAARVAMPLPFAKVTVQPVNG